MKECNRNSVITRPMLAQVRVLDSHSSKRSWDSEHSFDMTPRLLLENLAPDSKDIKRWGCCNGDSARTSVEMEDEPDETENGLVRCVEPASVALASLPQCDDIQAASKDARVF